MIQENIIDTMSTTAKTTTFNIELNATVFNMLTSKVYTDRISAPIRELSTNAIDACIDAKLPIRFDVHLPTQLEPTFSVRDYGTGLSDELIQTLYSTMGASTKRNSNAFNGTFGIGRMSCLAYTSSFQVDSFCNGIKTAYLITTSDGIPSTVTLGASKTDEENGLCVSFSVDHKDTTYFSQKAQNIYKYFEHKPNINTGLVIPEIQTVLSGDNWYIEKDTYSDQSTVIMGNVSYVIPADDLKNKIDNVYNLLRSSIRLIAPIGSVSITPGRESLSMDEKTINYIVLRIKKVRDEVYTSLIEKVKDKQTGWEQIIEYNALVETVNSNLLPATVDALNGVKHVTISTGYARTKKLALKIPYDSEQVRASVLSQSCVKLKNNYGDPLTITNRVHFMVQDVRHGALEAVLIYKAAIKGDPTVVLLRPHDTTKAGIKDSLVDVMAFIKDIGSPIYVLTSTYATEKSKANSGLLTARTATDFYPIALRLDGVFDVDFRKSYHTVNSYGTAHKFFYIKVSGHSPLDYTNKEVATFLRYLEIYKTQAAVKEEYSIIAIQKNAMPNIVGDARFIPIEEAIKDRPISIINHTHVHQLFDHMTCNIRNIRKIADKVSDVRVKKTLLSLLDFETNYPRHKSSTNTFGIEKFAWVVVKEPKLFIPLEEMLDMYPLLSTIIKGFGFSLDDTKVDSIVRYMELENLNAAALKSSIAA